MEHMIITDDIERELLNCINNFDQELALAREQHASRLKDNQKEKQGSNEEDELSEGRLLEIDFDAQETLEYFAQVVPLSAFDPQLLAQTQKIKMRYIPPQRKSPLFSPLPQSQKSQIKQFQKSFQSLLSPLPFPEANNPTNSCSLAWSSPKSSQIKLKQNNLQQIITITKQDLQKLSPNTDINDTIMENYLKLLRVYGMERQLYERVYCFSTFFMERIMSGVWGDKEDDKEDGREGNVSVQQVMAKVRENYPKVKNWTKKFDIFSKDYLIFPTHSGNHWNILLILHPSSLLAPPQHPTPRCKIIGLDPMFQMKTAFFDILKFYLKKKAQQQKLQNIEINSIQCFQVIVPRQTNHHDCGLYALTYVERIFGKDGADFLREVGAGTGQGEQQRQRDRVNQLELERERGGEKEKDREYKLEKDGEQEKKQERERKRLHKEEMKEEKNQVVKEKEIKLEQKEEKKKLGEIVGRRIFLDLFPRELIITMRRDLKNMLEAMIRCWDNRNGNIGEIVNKYWQSRRNICKQFPYTPTPTSQLLHPHTQQYPQIPFMQQTGNMGSYDTLDGRFYRLYCRLNPNSDENLDKVLLKYYYDQDINYYENQMRN